MTCMSTIQVANKSNSLQTLLFIQKEVSHHLVLRLYHQQQLLQGHHISLYLLYHPHLLVNASPCFNPHVQQLYKTIVNKLRIYRLYIQSVYKVCVYNCIQLHTIACNSYITPLYTFPTVCMHWCTLLFTYVDCCTLQFTVYLYRCTLMYIFVHLCIQLYSAV